VLAAVPVRLFIPSLSSRKTLSPFSKVFNSNRCNCYKTVLLMLLDLQVSFAMCASFDAGFDDIDDIDDMDDSCTAV
jgi:hypothetical protein